MSRRVMLIILDSCGCGGDPGADRYGDAGANTLGHIAAHLGGLALPNLQALGLGNLVQLQGVPASAAPQAAYGRMQERSVGKDTTTGHWEIAGVQLAQPFPTYPQGFPPEVVGAFERAIGREVLWNKVASGTEIAT